MPHGIACSPLTLGLEIMIYGESRRLDGQPATSEENELSGLRLYPPIHYLLQKFLTGTDNVLHRNNVLFLKVGSWGMILDCLGLDTVIKIRGKFSSGSSLAKVLYRSLFLSSSEDSYLV